MKISSKIYIIFGASGSGKTTLLHEIANTDIKYSIHTKGTTRKPRQYDGKEIIPVTEKEILEYEYIYERYGYKYGIDSIQIDDSLNNDLNHFIVCNDIKTIRDIKNRYKNSIKVLYLSYNAPKNTIEEIQKSRNISDDEIQLRLQKIDSLFDDYKNNSELFDHIINNIYGSPPTSMLKQLKVIVSSDNDMIGFQYSEMQEQLLNINNKLYDFEKLLLSSKDYIESSIEKDFVFIAMAMNTENYPRLDDYKNAYIRTCKELGLRANRIDDLEFQDETTEKILEYIRAAEIVIVDLTLNKPNVFYELGYAKAYGKTIILTAEKGTKKEFDTQNFVTIYYNSATDLEQKLKEKIKRIRATVANKM